ncbi:MAG: LacI family DNA-binding transcriptional regulator [Ilumatobacter fluminis]|uniref:LacI family DNA-binding transcriptional regulator n=1 Tax=Ilumatobacter fluminis TaxID=467091 RepID=UPI0032EBB5E3
MAASIREVAEIAGVSIATVSNVLNRPELVADPTIERVRAAITETGYVPNASARQLRVGSAPTINVVIPDISNPFFADLTSGVERVAAERDLAVLIASTEGDADREARYLRTIVEQRPTGVLITPADTTHDALALLGDRLPVVLVDRHSDGDTSSVSVDDVRGAAIAVDHLAELGHRRVTWVVGPDSIPQCAERTDGLTAAAARHDIAVTTMRVDHLTVAEGRSLAASLDVDDLPTAIVCANDLLALGVEFALLERGVHIPDDVSVVGFDDIEFGAAAAVPLTSVARPSAELGAAALELLLGERDDPDHSPRQIRFEPSLSVRRSTAAPRTP